MTQLGPEAALFVDWRGSVHTEGPFAIYFFKRREYIRWDVEREVLHDGYPRAIVDGWPGLLESFPDTPLAGAMHVPGWGNKIHFFFKGRDEVVTWDVPTHSIDAARSPISKIMPSALTEDGHFTPLYVDDGERRKVYAFRGDTYTRWTVLEGERPGREDRGYPRKIGDGWTSRGFSVAPTCAVMVAWTGREQAVSRKTYFFLGDLYARWDVASHSENYTLDIPTGWEGWPDFE
jgi:hypothetical protein